MFTVTASIIVWLLASVAHSLFAHPAVLPTATFSGRADDVDALLRCPTVVESCAIYKMISAMERCNTVQLNGRSRCAALKLWPTGWLGPNAAVRWTFGTLPPPWNSTPKSS